MVGVWVFSQPRQEYRHIDFVPSFNVVEEHSIALKHSAAKANAGNVSALTKSPYLPAWKLWRSANKSSYLGKSFPYAARANCEFTLTLLDA